MKYLVMFILFMFIMAAYTIYETKKSVEIVISRMKKTDKDEK